jgi:hypothetical protein
MAVECWRRDSDKCWRFSSKIKDAVWQILSEALVADPASRDEEVSEASSPIKQSYITTPMKPKEVLKRRYTGEKGISMRSLYFITLKISSCRSS